MSFIKIVFYLLLLLFFSSALYAESMHFDCKCNYEFVSTKDFTKNVDGIERVEKNNFCPDVHLEIKTDTKQMRVIEDKEYAFPEYSLMDSNGWIFKETDISFYNEYSVVGYHDIIRFDKYTGTLTRISYNDGKQPKITRWSRKVFRCEKVDKKY